VRPVRPTFLPSSVRTELPAFYAKLRYAPYARGPFVSRAPLTRNAHAIMVTTPLVPLW
jgi:hypothetical protein